MADLQETDGEFDLRRIFDVLGRRKRYVIGTFLAVVVAAGLFTFLQPPVYKASVDIMIATSSPALQTLGLPPELAILVSSKRGDLTAHIELIKSQPVLDRLRSRLAEDPEYLATLPGHRGGTGTAYAAQAAVLPDLDSLKEAISVRQVGTADMLRIEATGSSPVQAAKLANHLALAYQEADQARARRSLQAVLEFLDRKIEETRVQLNLSAEELANYARAIGVSWETQALVAKIARLEQLLAEASVQLEDTQAQLDMVERFLARVKDEMLERFSGPEGAAVLLEITDKLTLIRKIQREITQLEQDREWAFRAGDYIKAQDLESQIIKKRKDLEAAAAQQFKILEQLPQYEKLIQQQLDLKLKLIALENRVAVLKRSIKDEVERLIDTGLQLARLQRELDVSEDLYTLLLTQYAKTRVAEIGERGSVEIVNPAQTPTSPFRPNKPLNLLVGMFLGLLGGVGVAFLREALDTTFRSAQEVEQALGAPVVGMIPKIGTRKSRFEFEEVRQLLLPSLEPESIEVEAFTTLATNLRFLSPDKPLHSLLITSAGLGEGKSVVAVNLALTWAAGGKRVLLVEADLRRPTLQETLGLGGNARPGLTELTMGSATLEDVVHEVCYEGYGPLHFIAAGRKPPNVVEFLSSQAFGQTLAKLVDSYDLVILDSPPVNVVADPIVLARCASGVLLVLDAEKTTKGEIEFAHRSLVRGNATVVGAVLNKVSRTAGTYYYGYGRYYGARGSKRGQRKGNGPNRNAKA